MNLRNEKARRSGRAYAGTANVSGLYFAMEIKLLWIGLYAREGPCQDADCTCSPIYLLIVSPYLFCAGRDRNGKNLPVVLEFCHRRIRIEHLHFLIADEHRTFNCGQLIKWGYFDAFDTVNDVEVLLVAIPTNAYQVLGQNRCRQHHDTFYRFDPLYKRLSSHKCIVNDLVSLWISKVFGSFVLHDLD